MIKMKQVKELKKMTKKSNKDAEEYKNEALVLYKKEKNQSKQKQKKFKQGFRQRFDNIQILNHKVYRPSNKCK